MLASVDGFAWDDNEGLGILECKASERGPDQAENGEPGTLESPDHWLVQTQHAMGTTGAAWADIAVLIGGARLVIMPRVYRDDNFLAPLVLLEQAFHVRVQNKVRPEVDSSELSKAALSLLYPMHQAGQYVDVQEDWLADLDNQLQQAKADKKDAEARETAAGNALKGVIADAEGLRAGGLTYTWKAQARAGYTVEPSTVRILRRHLGKLAKANGKT